MDTLQAALRVQIVSLTARRDKADMFISDKYLQQESILLSAQIAALVNEYEARYGED